MVEEKPDLLIAEVDCTAEESESICEENGIEGFPTLKYGDADFLESYEGKQTTSTDRTYIYISSFYCFEKHSFV